MFYVFFILVFFVFFLIGTVGFSQITGSLRCAKIRGFGMTAFTVLLWAVILVVAFFVVKTYLPKYNFAMYAAYVISFFATLGTGKNGVE